MLTIKNLIRKTIDILIIVSDNHVIGCRSIFVIKTALVNLGLIVLRRKILTAVTGVRVKILAQELVIDKVADCFHCIFVHHTKVTCYYHIILWIMVTNEATSYFLTLRIGR